MWSTVETFSIWFSFFTGELLSAKLSYCPLQTLLIFLWQKFAFELVHNWSYFALNQILFVPFFYWYYINHNIVGFVIQFTVWFLSTWNSLINIRIDSNDKGILGIFLCLLDIMERFFGFTMFWFVLASWPNWVPCKFWGYSVHKDSQIFLSWNSIPVEKIGSQVAKCSMKCIQYFIFTVFRNLPFGSSPKLIAYLSARERF